MPNHADFYWIRNIPYFCSQAIFSDETINYRMPPEPSQYDRVTITLRAGRDIELQPYLCMETGRLPMEKMRASFVFDYYQVTLPPSAELIRYYFCIEGEGFTLYYTKYGVFEDYQSDGWFEILKNYHTPQWAKGAVMYQIYPDRFFNGDKQNDVLTKEYMYLGKPVKKVEDWFLNPDSEDIRNFYGGDLQGVIEKMDYLEDLGIDAIYLNPIFVSPSNHKYDIQDYAHIDPHLGVIEVDEGALLFGSEENKEATKYITRVTNEINLEKSDMLFATLVEEAHKRGIKVIIDGVFNHCGAFHKWLDKEGIYIGKNSGAYQDKNSPYRPYFYWDQEGEGYEGWWGYENHPKLNVEGCPKLREEIFKIATKWVSPPFCADGWRLDVAADLGRTEEFNHAFWREFRNVVKKANPNAVILAEHYGDAKPWLWGDEWDSIMNYDAFMEPLTWFLTGVSKHSTEARDDLYNNANVFWGSMSYQMAKLPIQAINTAMNELSNHDHSRFLTRTNRQLGRLAKNGAKAAEDGVLLSVMREAVLFQMTWLGSPTIYYGDEAGVMGWTDPDNRRTYPWGRENIELIEFHKTCIRLRKENEALRFGSLKQLFGEYGIIGYGRFTELNKCVIVLNNNNCAKEIYIPLWQIGVREKGRMKSLLSTEETGYHRESTAYVVENGHIRLLLPPKSGVLLKEV
ncbi:glycoside hydrolase family 13 protein [Anaerotignum sp. MB30-C6]|uniref:glycoside hydrolase family 13 protein n=1 Tax=Anaerotignum sp. MB30-C6 TaxID=3070814 RepID=UPI0027DE1C80|nr:glycoside hydrolase family 13 protein [Anaerotignum sp. MB30-C6]WMI82242.1 glycoside hydrolase family 13 protein [Anaerotignum sp. MB30-C6]